MTTVQFIPNLPQIELEVSVYYAHYLFNHIQTIYFILLIDTRRFAR